jgi:prepilin-type N-terminal cleavage/methylation domain-containing protein
MARAHYGRFGPLQAGFSLVELAVVLVVAGLLLGAALKGRALIATAEYRAFDNALEAHARAFRTFRARYDALPGDLARAGTRFGLAGANGDGDGIIDGPGACPSARAESCLAWRHLRAAGLIDGDPAASGADAAPEHAYGGAIAGLFTGTAASGRFGHWMTATAVPAEAARRLDRALDDGRCDTGRVAARRAGGDACRSGDWPAGDDRVDLVYAL